MYHMPKDSEMVGMVDQRVHGWKVWRSAMHGVEMAAAALGVCTGVALAVASSFA